MRDEIKYKNFLKIIEGFDILCFQEDVIPNPNSVLGKLTKGAESLSHKLSWSKSNAIYNPTGNTPTYLANSIYTTELFAGGIGNLKSNTKLINFPGIEDRSVVLYCTPINKNFPISIVIANTHLSGGRYEDEYVIQEILSGTYTNYKYEQIKKILDLKPDIIVGDFNAKFFNPNYPELINGVNTHRDNLLQKISNTNSLEVFNYVQQLQWEDWIWITRLDLFLKANGYTNAYTVDEILDTNSYLGACDMIYYKTDVLTQVGKATIINNPIVMENNNNQYTPILSDHFPVQAEFTINEKYFNNLEK
jgi:endonuclease/exonuclease/phosphatase family metal-dependent hydrolase